MEKKRSVLIGPILLLITAFLWGTTLIAQKLGSDYVGPFTYNTYRFTISGVLLFAYFFIRKKIKKYDHTEQLTNIRHDRIRRNKIIIYSLLVGLSLFMGATLQQFGIKYTDPGKAGFLSSTYMLMVPIIGLFFKKKIKIYVWICVDIALVGSYLITYKSGDGFQIGDLIILISALGYAFQIVFVDKVGKYVNTIFLSAFQLLMTGLLSFILKIIFEPFDFEAFKGAFFAILYAAIFSGCIAFTFQIFGQKTTPPTIASMIMSLESVFSLLASVVILHETMALKEWIGSGLIFGSIILYQLIFNLGVKKNMKKITCFIFALIISIFLISCTNKSEKTKEVPTPTYATITTEEVPTPSPKTEVPPETSGYIEPTPIIVTNIEVINKSVNYDINHFNIYDLKILVTYSDSHTIEINLNDDIIDIHDFSNIGYYNLNISYEGFSINYDFALVDVVPPREFSVLFYVDGELYRSFTVFEGEGITDVPEVPEKTGYDGSWDILDFSIIYEDLVVNAIYEENDVMKIREVVKGLYEYYNDLIDKTINSDIELVDEFMDASIFWSSSDVSAISSTGKYRRDYEPKKVTLTATVELGTEVRECTFNVTTEGFRDLSKPISSGYLYRNYDKLTDEFFDCMDIIYCAFAPFNDDGSFNAASTLAKIKSYVIPKAHERGIYVVLSLGGGDSSAANHYKNMTANDTYLNNFANNCVKLINDYDLDGVDFDWETPASSNKASFTKMAKIVYEKVKANNPHHLVTAAIGGGMWQPPKYDLENSCQYLDFINVMTYSMCSNSGYYQNALFKHSSNDDTVHECGRTLSSCSIAETISIYNNLGVPNSKLIFGLAFYGVKQTYADGAWGSGSSVLYYNIVKNYLNNSNYEYHYDSVAQVPYILSKDGKTFISYDDRTSILAKAKYMIETGCAGLMNWEIGCDYVNYELTKAMRDGLKNN